MWKYFKLSAWRRLYFKVVRQEGTPESLAMGVAIGVFAGFLIPTGGQFVFALTLAFIFKANKALSLLGTMITNPYTAPFFVPAQCWIGAIALGSPLEFSEVSRKFGDLMTEPSWDLFMQLGGDLLFPLLLGGAIFAVVLSVPSYYLTLYWVKGHRRRKHERMLKRNARGSTAGKGDGDSPAS